MAELHIQLQGPRGGNWKGYDNQGKLAAFVDHENDQRIIIDSFKGSGEDYKRRENSQIAICNGNIEWVGTFQELCKKLKIDKYGKN